MTGLPSWLQEKKRTCPHERFEPKMCSQGCAHFNAGIQETWDKTRERVEKMIIERETSIVQCKCEGQNNHMCINCTEQEGGIKFLREVFKK